MHDSELGNYLVTLDRGHLAYLIDQFKQFNEMPDAEVSKLIDKVHGHPTQEENIMSSEVTEETTVDATEPELATMVTNSEEQADEPDDTAEEQESPNVEAAKWRKQFLEAETQLAEMGQRVQALQRQQIEGLINQAGVKPAAVWAVAELGTLVGEDGTVDAAAVSAAIDNARTQLGIQPIGKGVCVPSVGGQPSALPQTDAWENAFAPRKRQNDGARQTPSPGDRWPAPFFPPGADTARCQP